MRWFEVTLVETKNRRLFLLAKQSDLPNKTITVLNDLLRVIFFLLVDAGTYALCTYREKKQENMAMS